MTKEANRTDVSKAKRLARRVSILAMEGMALGTAKQDSLAVCRLVLESTVWLQASQVMLYIPVSGELNVKLLIENALKKRKILALPRFSVEKDAYEICGVEKLSHLMPGKFGISEPSPDSKIMDTKQLDLAIVPGVAFSCLGNRLGRGGGFFDRLLTSIPAKKCGVCFKQQVYPDVPMERHDVKMDMIATPNGWLIPPPS